MLRRIYHYSAWLKLFFAERATQKPFEPAASRRLDWLLDLLERRQ
jgi:hypothetical protein